MLILFWASSNHQCSIAKIDYGEPLRILAAPLQTP